MAIASKSKKKVKQKFVKKKPREMNSSELKLKEEINALVASGMSVDDAIKKSGQLCLNIN